MTIILGDTHGRDCWKEIIKRETFDRIIFLGDYVSTHDRDITEDDQINNLEEILRFKEKNPDRVILLRGNHDGQHVSDKEAFRCSGFFPNVSQYLHEMKDRFAQDTQWIFVDENNVIYSHAGVSQTWMDYSGFMNLEEVNMAPLEDERFGFTPDTPWDCYGDSVTQPPTWIRPSALAECNIKGYDQVVGHTPMIKVACVYKSTKAHQKIWFCDTLPNQYLLNIDGEFIIRQFSDKIFLPNREGRVWLEKIENPEYNYVLKSDPKYITEYCTCSLGDDNSILSIDPSGGPYMRVGGEVEGMILEKIDSNRLYFKLVQK